jgi:hypothetical protein
MVEKEHELLDDVEAAVGDFDELLDMAHGEEVLHFAFSCIAFVLAENAHQVHQSEEVVQFSLNLDLRALRRSLIEVLDQAGEVINLTKVSHQHLRKVAVSNFVQDNELVRLQDLTYRKRFQYENNITKEIR